MSIIFKRYPIGAMWIDSNKNLEEIQSTVYNMLNIQFELANVEKTMLVD